MLRTLAAVAILALAGAAHAAEPLAARVNGEAITRERLDRFFEARLEEQGRHVAAIRSPEAFRNLRREALDALVDRELLWQEAQRRKRVVSGAEVEAAMAAFRQRVPDPARRRLDLERAGFTEETYTEHVRRELSIRRLLERDVAARVRVTDAEVRAFHRANPERFTRPAEVRARHVLVSLAAGAAPEARAEARRKIDEVLAAARGGADLAELARRHSDDSTAAAGGDLGWFRRGTMVPPFEAAAFALEPGQVSEVIETPFGFHVLRVEGKRPEARLPEAEVREEVRAHLRAERVREATDRTVTALRGKARVELLAAAEVR